MKTTVEIADGLLDEARRVASEERTTVRALIEEGLRQALQARRRGAETYRFELVTFGSGGLRPEVEEGGWERIRGLAYEDHGA